MKAAWIRFMTRGAPLCRAISLGGHRFPGFRRGTVISVPLGRRHAARGNGRRADRSLVSSRTRSGREQRMDCQSRADFRRRDGLYFARRARFHL